MNCSPSTALSDDDISAALDGDADARVWEHLSGCPVCQRKLVDARRFEQGVKMQFRRMQCPTPAELGDYEFGWLDSAARKQFELHLKHCHFCQQELAELRHFLQSSGQPAPPEPAQTFQSRLQSLLLALIPPSPAAVLRGSRLRGSSRKKNVVLGAESVRVFMGLEADDAGVTISGQLTNDRAEANWEGTLLELRRSGTRVAVTLVDEDGYFECGPLATGPADLKISSSQGHVFHIEGLELNPAGE